MSTGFNVAAGAARAGLALRRSVLARAKTFAVTLRPAVVIVAACLALTATQILVGAFLAGKGGIRSGWRAFWQFDSGWFLMVAEGGYFKPPVISPQTPGNLHFFPAYPLACR